MINFRPSETRTSPATSSAVTAEKAFSFISKGWREVKDSTEADLQLMKDRAKSFKNLASSFDREFENFLTSASRSTFPVPAISNSSSLSTAEIDFVKKLQPKLSEFRRAYSSPDFSKRVLEKWSPRAKIRIDLSAIRNAIVSEVEDGDGREGYRRTRVRDFSWEWKVDGDDGQVLKHWEPIRALKTRLRELEHKSSSSEIIEGLKNSELMEKVKSSLKAICKEPEYSKEVPPLDFQELLACLVRQSGPFLDYLGVKRGNRNLRIFFCCNNSFGQNKTKYYGNINVADLSDKILESLCSKKKNQLLLRSFPTGESSILEGENINDELDIRIASVLQSTGHHYEAHQKNKKFIYVAGSRKELVSMPTFKISFYPGKFQKERGSIIPAGDTSQFISSKDADIAILEEPEHLNWYHHGKRWTDKFNHVVGVVHTNYLEYIKREKNGAVQAFFVKHINNWVTRAYCDKVLRLSAATQDLPKSVICNVHGVNPKFLEIGERMAANKEEGGEKKVLKRSIFLG
ncbi:hypothetical protein R6Q59_027739 [Mikania micrantha]